MATCQIKYNGLGKIDTVLDKDGNPSYLYDTIARHPFVESKEKAAEIYKNIFTSKVDEESSFTNKTKYGYTDSFKEALDESQDGDIIEVGFQGKDFVKIMSIEVNTNPKTLEGFIQLQIKNGLLSEKKVLDPNGSFFKAAGETSVFRAINSAQLEEEMKLHLGLAGFKRHKGNKYEFKGVKPKVTYEKNSVDAKLAEELAKSSMMRTFGKDKVIDTPSTLTQDELKVRLLNLLNSLGIKITSISDYISKYNDKHGVDPSAEALADIAEKVIAFNNNEITIEALTEEVAHFIVEGFPQDQVENLLRNIHLTNEWAEFSENYRQIYAKNHKGEELEQAVRREVLGKVLANSLQRDFSTENAVGQQKNIIDKIKDLFLRFFEKINSYIKPSHVTDIQNFAQQVRDMLMRDELGEYLSQDNFVSNKFRFYSVSNSQNNPISQIRVAANAAIKVLQAQINDLAKAKKSSGVSKQQLKQALADLESNTTLQSITTLLEVTRKQINHIEEALNNNAKDDYSLSQEEVTVFESLQNDLFPILAELRERVRANPSTDIADKKQWEAIESRATESLDKIAAIKGKRDTHESDVLDKLVAKVKERHNLDDSYDNYIKAWFETAKQDTSYFHSTFGQMVHNNDALLGMAGMVIQDTVNEGRINYLKNVKAFQKAIKDLGFKEKDLDQFFEEGGYLLDVINHKKFQDTQDKIKVEAFEEVAKTGLPVEELMRRFKSPSREAKDSLPVLTSSQEIEMNKIIRQKLLEETERVMQDSYYEEKEAKYEQEGINQLTINFLRAISQNRGEIIQAARKPDGTIDRTLLSERDNRALDQLSRERKTAKNPYASTGSLKKGLIINPSYVKYEPEFILDENEAKPSNEAIIAADLYALDARYLRDNKDKENKGIPQKFLDALESAEVNGNLEALNFLRLNAHITFSQSFWDSFGDDVTVRQRLENFVNDNSGEISANAQELLTSINSLAHRRKNLIKIYQNPNQPSEIDVEYMDKNVKAEIKELSQQISELQSKAYRLLKDTDPSESEAVSEITTNEAYKKELKDRNITTALQEVEFIKDHITESSYDRVKQLETFLKDYQNGLMDRPPLAIRRYVEDNIDLDNFDVGIEVRNFAKLRLLPYYTRIAPEGHQLLMSQLNNGVKSPVEFVKEVLRGEHNIEINPNYSYFQQDTDETNPNYQPDYEGGFLQPKQGKYRNQRFEELFAPEKDVKGNYRRIENQNGVKEYVPTKNKELYKLYELTKQFQRDNLEQLGELGSHNLYKLPQISKTNLEKMTSFAKGASMDRVKEWAKDISFYRVDEMARGAEFDGQTLSNSKIIPKYYLRDLENPDDISQQLFSSYAAFAQQAYLHRARRNNIGDMFALRERMLTRTTASGKAAESTRTAKMFESYMDANFFGITEQSTLKMNILGREIDLTKLARKFLNFIKLKNLGFSAIVPATSWLTAEVNSKIEQWVQEHTNTRSGQMAFSEYKKLAPAAIKEFAALQSNSKLAVLGEYMGIYDIENRYANSSYNDLTRTGTKAAMGLHQAANFPIIPRLMLSVLMDTRVVNGNIINFNDFARLQKKKKADITKKEIEAEWSKFEDNAIYNYMDISETTVELDKGRLEKELNKTGEELDRFLKNKMNGIQSRIEEVSSNIDGSISQHRQVAASRHYLFNYFMTHRNWLTIATSRRFKFKQTNLQTGEVEEGSWVSMYGFIGETLKQMSGGGKNFREAIRDQWANADETQRKNIRRVGIDLAVLNGMVLIGFLLANMADDEDNEDLWALQFVNYLYHRTMSETASSSIALPVQYMDTIESPFVGLNTVQEIGKLYKIFDFSEVEAGKYRGMTVAERQIIKTMPGVKQAREILNPKEASDTYRFYNQENFNMIPLYWFLNDK